MTIQILLKRLKIMIALITLHALEREKANRQRDIAKRIRKFDLLSTKTNDQRKVVDKWRANHEQDKT